MFSEIKRPGPKILANMIDTNEADFRHRWIPCTKDQ